MTETLRIAAFQRAPTPRAIERNIDEVRRAIAAGDADLVVFPELYLSGYQTSELHEIAMSADDPRLQHLVEACRSAGTALLVGFVEATPAGFFDSYLAIDRDGTIREPVRKTHLFGAERGVFLAGDLLEPVELCDVRMGVINCFEIEFPEVARTLAMSGARVLIAGSANMHPYEQDHRVAAVARALENRLPLAYANRVGEEGGHRFCGLSAIVTGEGEVLGRLGTEESGVVRAEVAVSSQVRAETDMLAQRRPELYTR